MIEYRPELFSVVIDLSNIGQWGSLLSNCHRLRKRVCVDDLGWAHPSVDKDFEFDEYDNLGVARYLVITRDGVEPQAMVRLISTQNQYMLQSLQDRIEGFKCPARLDIWEMSRLVIEPDLNLTDTIEAVKVLERSLEKFSRANEIANFIAWVSQETLRLLKLAGYELTEVSELIDDEGKMTSVVLLRTTDANLTDEYRSNVQPENPPIPMSNLNKRAKRA